MTKVIRIRRTYHIAYVSDEDYDLVRTHKWYLWQYDGRGPYACTGGKGPPIYMHRLIKPAPNGLVTSHKNHNGLDNRRENLECITHMENLQHKRIYTSNTSGVPGVKKYKYRPGWWEAQITQMGRRIYLGVYPTFELAVEARKIAEGRRE